MSLEESPGNEKSFLCGVCEGIPYPNQHHIYNMVKLIRWASR